MSASAPSRLHPVRVAARGTRSSILAGARSPRAWALGLLILLVIVGTAVWAHASLKNQVERKLAAELSAVLDTATHGTLGFLEDAERLAAIIAEAPEVRSAAAQVPAAGSPSAGQTTPMARALGPYLEAGRLAGFVVTDARGTVLEVGGGLARLGERLPQRTLPTHAAARQHGPRAGLPFRDVQGRVRLAVAVPVPGADVLLGIGLEQRLFSAPLLAARVGRTGETYAFDRHGLMISTSRFPHHLRAAGLLGPDEDDSALRVALRNPGDDMTTGFRPQARRRDQPLTVMAASATAGRAGVAVEPYRDYRGVPVVGAWQWLDDRGLGIASEVDAAEAFEPLRALERVFGALVALLVLAGAGTVLGAAIAERARQHAERAEHEARRVGEYVIERRLGAGAMGEVFLARHALLRRPTAVKLLRPGLASAEALERFEREVQVTAALTHPNTIAIYDYGRSVDGVFYYAMEFLDGIDLESLVTHFGALPEGRVIHLLRQVCGSLGEGHEAGIVHRDVKPANLYLCRRGGVPDVVKVLDFGLVKATESLRITRASVMVGTPENMAPELFESPDNATPSSDIYALGCVGYALLTGARPFAGSSLAEVCNAHLSRAAVPPSRRLGRVVDTVLERTILACLAKRPGERPGSTCEIVAMLDRSHAAATWTTDDAEAFWAMHRARIAELQNHRGG